MEVEAHGLSTFDLNSGNLTAFSLRNRPEFLVPNMSGSPKQPSELEKVTGDQMAEHGGEWEATAAPTSPAAALVGCPSNAAMKLQKVYRSYRTRRMLADSAVVAEELWWQALDFARLNHSTISFFNFLKPETAASRWNRIGLNASKVGKGLSKDAKAQKLAFQHWIEAIDPRHRYGHSLHFYYEEWCKTNAGQPFFYWLDLGDGKEVDLKECPRSKLRQQCIKYLGPKEREQYEYVLVDGRILHKVTGYPLDTNKGSPGSKWIFVMSTSKRLYIGEKKKGLFHHSSFLAGGATLAAGRLIAEDGVLKCISAYSGHYKPTDERLGSFLLFLEENGVNLDDVEKHKANDDYENNENGKISMDAAVSKVLSISDSVQCDLPNEEEELSSEAPEVSKPETKNEYKRTLSGGLQSPKADVPRISIMQRINSKKAAKSYQLGHQLSVQWSTGVGPRIGCIADYPLELRLQALELTKLSPRTCPPLSTPGRSAALVSPSCPPNISNDDVGALYLA
ncbi:IQ domain-containing protein IQM3-like isoform X2 [Sesamum indicum]|uniref:IQ domain-containing protein IQM3-like isoform X2 n=1 Tax=Sesamum indicum TaxID=4182 RepID=A0A6I9U5D7_SESIN|nr:IQ domain-containing protein IQM3-like isoform X2 [Sesamum indicum]